MLVIYVGRQCHYFCITPTGLLGICQWRGLVEFLTRVVYGGEMTQRQGHYVIISN
jgi:hypothetical protein